MGLINSNVPELEGTDTETSLANLDRLEGELELVLERRIAHITELADAIMSDGEDEDIIKSIILSVKFDPEYDNERFAPENAGELRSLYSTISLAERLIIFRRITSRLYSNKKAIYAASLYEFLR